MVYEIKILIIILLFQDCCITKNNLKGAVEQSSYNMWPDEDSTENAIFALCSQQLLRKNVVYIRTWFKAIHLVT